MSSSCEDEYISLTFAVQEGLFFIQLMRDMDFGGDYESFSLQGNNKGSLALAKNPIKPQRSKHIYE